MFICTRFCYYICHCPCCLQIKTAGDGVYIQYFSRKEQSFVILALESRRIYVRQCHASACDKLVFEAVFTIYIESVARKA